MSDFKIDVGFNTDELKAAMSGAGGGAGASSGAESSGGGFGGFAKAIKAGLMATGIIGILMNLKVILEIVGFAIAAISSILGLLLIKSLDFFNSFTDDIFKSFLKVGIIIVNGVISAIEFMMNALLGVLTMGKVGGFGENKIELPRFQEEVILEAYDNLAQVTKDVIKGTAGLGDLVQASKDFQTGVINSFMTNDEFEFIKGLKEESGETFANTFGLLEAAGVDISTAVELGSTQVISSADSAFSSMAKTMKYLEDQADKLRNERSNSSRSGDYVTFKANEKKSTFEKNLDFVKGFGDPNKWLS